MNQFNSDSEATAAMELAFGRILRMGAREEQRGDVEEYERCKWIIMDAGEYLGFSSTPDWQPNYAKDYNK